MSFTNPILPGFYPDPSCIRVDDTFYLITSSFQFFPGLPIHRSKDLVNWELIGHAINRPSQLSLHKAVSKVNNVERGEVFTAGLYAPTLRYHNGTFWIACTNLTGRKDFRSDEDFQPSNFIIRADDLTEPASFSDPMHFDFYGIDPSLFFDDDGRVYMTGSFIISYKVHPATSIQQAEIDLSTGQLKSKPQVIWGGTGGKCPEGPHLYKKDGQYWLVIAEGGTHRRHCITAAKSSSPWGPFESFAGNPLLTTKGPESPLQCIGHGELFDDVQGNWWCTMLARREFGASYPLGRETYLTTASWPEGEFPIIAPLELQQRVEDRDSTAQLAPQKVRHVTLTSPETLFLRGFSQEFYKEVDGEIILRGMGSDLDAAEGETTFMGTRQTALSSRASVILNLDASPQGNGSCGLVVYQDTFRYLAVRIDSENNLSLVCQEAGQRSETPAPQRTERSDAYRLSISSTVDSYSFWYTPRKEGEWTDQIKLGEISTKLFSTDDFTGPVYAIFASGTREARFQDFQAENL